MRGVNSGKRKAAMAECSEAEHNVLENDLHDDSYIDLEDEALRSSEDTILDNSMSGSTADHGWGRLPVAFVLCGRLMPDSTAATCYKSFRKKMDPTGYNWKAVDTELVEDYFIEFKKQYSWPEDQEVVIKKHWLKMAADRYSDFCSKVIKKCVGKAKPDFIMEEDWPGWLAHFGSKKFTDKSSINSKNRKSEVGGPGTGPSNHTCGSKKILSHMIQMTKDNGGVPPAFYEVQRKTHVSRKTGEFIDQRSAKVNEKVITSVEGGEEALKNMSKEEADRHYWNAVGGVKKQRLYGVPDVGKSFGNDSGKDDLCSSSSGLEQILSQRMEAEREKMEAQMKEKMEIERAQLEAQMNEKMEKERAQMEAQMNEKLQIERAQMDGKILENSERMGQFEKEMQNMKSAMAKYFGS